MMSVLDRYTGLLAAVLGALAILGFGAALDGYVWMQHPVALLGAGGVPHALAFNLLGWVLPGALGAIVALRLLQRLPVGSGWSARVGAQMLLLAALAYAGMGLAPLQIEDLDGPASQLHASAWMVWILAFVAGATLLAAGTWRGVARSMALVAAAAALLALVAGFGLQGLVPQPLAQRLAFAAWGLWLALALPLLGRAGR